MHGLIEGLRKKLRRTRVASEDSELLGTAIKSSKDTPAHRRGRSSPGGQRRPPKQRRPAGSSAARQGSSTQALQEQFQELQEQYVLLMGGLAKRQNASAAAAAAASAAASAATAAAATAAAARHSPRGSAPAAQAARGAPQPLQPSRDHHARLVNLVQRRPAKPPTPSQLLGPKPGSPSVTPAASASSGRASPPKTTGAPPKSPLPGGSPGLKQPPGAAQQGRRQRSVSLAAEAPASRNPSRPPRKTFTAHRAAWVSELPAAPRRVPNSGPSSSYGSAARAGGRTSPAPAQPGSATTAQKRQQQEWGHTSLEETLGGLRRAPLVARAAPPPQPHASNTDSEELMQPTSTWIELEGSLPARPHSSGGPWGVRARPAASAVDEAMAMLRRLQNGDDAARYSEAAAQPSERLPPQPPASQPHRYDLSPVDEELTGQQAWLQPTARLASRDYEQPFGYLPSLQQQNHRRMNGRDPQQQLQWGQELQLPLLYGNHCP